MAEQWIQDKLTGEIYHGPQGVKIDQTQFDIIPEPGVGPLGNQADEKQGLAESSTKIAPSNVNTNDIPTWLMTKLSELGQETKANIGGLAGGMAGPAIAGAMLGGPMGLAGGIAAGAIGGYGGQAAQDYLTKGALDTGNEIKQGLIGAAGPVVGKMASGAGVLGTALARKAGLLKDLYSSAVNSADTIGTTGLEALAKSMPQDTSSPIAERSAEFINNKIGLGQNNNLPAWLQKYLGQPAGPTPSIPIKDFEAIREDVASLGQRGTISGKISGNWYRQVMDILRNEASGGNQAASDLLQNANEMEALRTATPSHMPWWLGGASAAGMGMGYMMNNPMAAGLTGAGLVGIPIGKSLLSAGTYNPYISSLANLPLEHMFGGK